MKGKTKPRIFKFVILAMLATILVGFFGVGGTKSANPKPIDPSNAPIDAEKFFSGDPAYKPDIYNVVTFENKSLNKNGQNIENIFRARTTGGRGFQFDATFKQIYKLDPSTKVVLYHKIGIGTNGETIEGGTILGTPSLSAYPMSGYSYKKISDLDVYQMKNHPTYYLVTEKNTTTSQGIVYKNGDEFPLAQTQASSDNGLGVYIKWYSIFYSYDTTTQGNITKIFGAGNYEVSSTSGSGNRFIDNGESSAPQILIKGNSSLGRPDITFTLTHVWEDLER